MLAFVVVIAIGFFFVSRAIDRLNELENKEWMRRYNAKVWSNLDEMNRKTSRAMLEVIRIESRRTRAETSLANTDWEIIGIDYNGKTYFGDWKIEDGVTTVRYGRRFKSGRWPTGTLKELERTRTPEALARSLLYELSRELDPL
jgi:hypothetical protein